eukprot:gb/GEZN01015105.1/.p1 GENE.gb/GEZN01015105.1/~~gb/GEZN01015105.1/.p1  ORF type:complete len:267 (-),score=43.20 gb/GEZN01015105.1/:113-871(-)
MAKERADVKTHRRNWKDAVAQRCLARVRNQRSQVLDEIRKRQREAKATNAASRLASSHGSDDMMDVDEGDAKRTTSKQVPQSSFTMNYGRHDHVVMRSIIEKELQESSGTFSEEEMIVLEDAMMKEIAAAQQTAAADFAIKQVTMEDAFVESELQQFQTDPNQVPCCVCRRSNFSLSPSFLLTCAACQLKLDLTLCPKPAWPTWSLEAVRNFISHALTAHQSRCHLTPGFIPRQKGLFLVCGGCKLQHNVFS